MNAPEPRLAQVQRWMQTVIMHRGGVAEGVDSPEAREAFTRHVGKEARRAIDRRP